MEFRILGPLEVLSDDHSLPLGGGKQRALLAGLVLEANRVVTFERLIELVWGEESPDTARNVLQVYVSQLRKVLEAARRREEAPQVLVRRSGGYVLVARPDQVDLQRFEHLTYVGRQAFADGKPQYAAATLREALALWRGPALADIDAPFATAERARLEELRLAAVEDRIQADPQLGAHADVIAELQALVAQHPLRERISGQLMLALYRSGRQAEASAVFHNLRKALDEELGMEPGAEVQKLLTDILNHSPSLEVAHRSVTEGTAPPLGGFLGALPEHELVGRAAELQHMLSAIDVAAGGQGQLTLISGEPGVGKTRLVQEVMVRARDKGFLVVVGRCYQQNASLPFFPFREVFNTDIECAADGVRANAARSWPDLAHVIPQFGAGVAGLEGEEGQQRVLQAATGFLRALAAEAPLAVLLDDLHWADSASLELLRHLSRHLRSSRVLLLGTYRDVEVGWQHPLEAMLRDLTRERLVDQLDLRRLPAEGTAALIKSAFGNWGGFIELASLVHERTEGNAFFIEEVLKALVEP